MCKLLFLYLQAITPLCGGIACTRPSPLLVPSLHCCRRAAVERPVTHVPGMLNLHRSNRPIIRYRSLLSLLKKGCVNCRTVTPPKPVHKHGPGSSTSTAGKKKEFDPSQSLVFQMLQEENERAKRGYVGEPVEEEPNVRRQPPPPQQQQPAAGRRRQQPQQGSRLQELLERDRAASQQEEDEHLRHIDTRPQPQQPRQPAPRHHNQQRTQPPQPAGSSYHSTATYHQSTYMKGSPGGSYYQQPTNPSYEEYYQQGYYQNAPHMAGYSSYGQEGVPISEF